MTQPRLIALASVAMVAFAANSWLARAALLNTGADPASFSAVRLMSGAVVLQLFVAQRDRRIRLASGSWWSALALFIYAVAFSFSYVQLSAGTGALLLFGCVQITMLLFGWARGDRFSSLQWLGFTIACSGLAYLLVPGATAPDWPAAILMGLAGVAWGVYSLRAGGADPISTSAGNFVRTVPMCLGLLAVLWTDLRLDSAGWILALASGVITSGMGYVVWYQVLPRISVLSASTIQLSVPVLAALMGVAFLGESVTARLVLADTAVLAGIGLVLWMGPRPRQAGGNSTPKSAQSAR